MTMQTKFSIEMIPHENKENMLEWAQMFLERVDVNAENLVDLINLAYENGRKTGRLDEVCANFPNIPKFSDY
ncbi:MAG: hypothetical protein WC905_02525 [Patescibacteria group bacterium]